MARILTVSFFLQRLFFAISSFNDRLLPSWCKLPVKTFFGVGRERSFANFSRGNSSFRPRLFSNSGKRFRWVVKAGRSGNFWPWTYYNNVYVYTFRRKREKEWSRLSKRVKDFYDRPLETRFIAAFRSVPLRFAKRRVGVPTRSRRLVRRPRFFVTEFLLADENTSFYVRERRKKKEAQTRHLTKSRTPLLYGNFRASSRVEALTIIRGIMNEEQ